MNKTKIEWCDMTWNPVTGCLHGCEYCYASRIATRFADKTNLTYVDGVKPPHLSNVPYPYGFLPTLHPNRLDQPQKVKKPQKIFVCSMADLFGDWVPDEWIEKVFDACEKAPQHKYLFLTKNPARYEQFDRHMPPNMWFGWTQTKPKEVPTFATHHSWHTFISLEPLLEEFKAFRISGMRWAIVGAETGNRKGKIVPEKRWIDSIVATCREVKVPVFMKDSLKDLMGNDFIQEWPEELLI